MMMLDVALRRPRGQPLKLNASRARAYCAAIELGLPAYAASERAGLAVRTCENYVNRGRAAEAHIVRAIADLDDLDWQALNDLDDTPPAGNTTDADGWPALSPRDAMTIMLAPPRERVFVRFLREITKAWANFEARHLAEIAEASRGYDADERTETVETLPDGTIRRTVTTRTRHERSWQAAAWQLERRLPERYSQIRRHEIAGVAGQPIEHEHTVTVDATEALRQLRGAERDERSATILSVLSGAGVSIDDAVVIEDEGVSGGGDDTEPSPNGDRPPSDP